MIRLYNKVISSSLNIVIQYNFIDIATKHFGLPVEHSGLMLSYTGCIALLMQGFGIPLITAIFSDKSLLTISTLALTVSYAIMVSLNVDSFQSHVSYVLQLENSKTSFPKRRQTH